MSTSVITNPYKADRSSCPSFQLEAQSQRTIHVGRCCFQASLATSTRRPHSDFLVNELASVRNPEENPAATCICWLSDSPRLTRNFKHRYLDTAEYDPSNSYTKCDTYYLFNLQTFTNQYKAVANAIDMLAANKPSRRNASAGESARTAANTFNARKPSNALKLQSCNVMGVPE